MRKKYLKDKKTLLVALASAFSLSVTGCSSEMAPDKSNIDMIDTNEFQNEEEDLKISKQENINGEDFKLNIDYICENGSEWRINDTKKIYMSINTVGLPDNKEVYIDNIHSDTYIVSTKAIYNGIKQDTMDDRIHNGLIYGFPISDTNNYYGCNTIEGQNSEFIQSFTYAYQGTMSSAVSTKRRLESDFLEKGVYANQIENVIDLIIIDKDTNEIRTVSVSSNILIKINNRVTFIENNQEIIYEYDMNGNKSLVEKKLTRELTK